MWIKGNKMLKKVCKMLINVGNWRAEMSENVERECHEMLDKNSSNVTKCG